MDELLHAGKRLGVLATLVRDIYRTTERRELRDAVDDLASPNDTYGWASVGIYVFFDPDSRDVLYVGLARDLAERFAQHNGLVVMEARHCKSREIDEWFASREALGYAVLLQSPMDQVSVGRQRGTPSAAYYDEETDEFYDYPTEGLEEARHLEGTLIASYRARHGVLPPWNKIGGSVAGAGDATTGGYNVLALATGQADSLLLARKTLRELSADPSAVSFEQTLHLGRINAITETGGVGIDTPRILRAIERSANSPWYRNTGLPEQAERLRTTGYCRLPPPPPADACTPGTIERVEREGE